MLDSKMEVLIHNILTDYDVPFEEEYTFNDLTTSKDVPLRFDFAVFRDDGELDFLIEAQGRQHYVEVPHFGGKKGLNRQKYNDTRKRKYCLDHNINLITIPHLDENRITYDYIMHLAGY